jgi:hypothetical protein
LTKFVLTMPEAAALRVRLEKARRVKPPPRSGRRRYRNARNAWRSGAGMSRSFGRFAYRSGNAVKKAPFSWLMV